MVHGTLLGSGLFVVGLAGCVTGLYTEYPGRALSLTAGMVGVTLVAIARRSTVTETT